MAENERKEKSVDVDNSTQREENSTINEYRKEINKVQNDAEKGINSILEEARNKLSEAELFKAFIAENPNINAKSIDELSPDDKSKYEKYVSDETDKSYEITKNGVIQKTKERMEKLDDIGKRLDQLQKESVSKLEELKKERDGLSPDDPKRKELDSQINSLQSVISGIGEKAERGSTGLRGKLGAAFNANEKVKEDARAALIDIYGKERVENDKDINDTLAPAKDQSKEERKNESEKQNQSKEELEKNGQDNKNKQQVQGEKGNPLNGAIPAAAAAKVVADGLEEQGEKAQEIPDGMKYLNSLGYDGSVLNPKSSRQLLDAFVNADEKAQIGILGDKDAQKKIFEAMKKANNRWTPVSAIKFNKTRRALLEMANGPMMRKALESVGKDVDYRNLDQMGSQFKSVLRDYEANRTKKQREIDALPDGEQKSKLQAELDQLDKEYGAISGVNEFRNISNKELNRFRDRVVNRMSSLFDRSDMDKLSLPSKNEAIAQENREAQYNRARGIIEQDRDNGFRKNIQRNVSSIEEKTNDELKQEVEQKEKSNLARDMNEQQRANAAKYLNSKSGGRDR